MELMGAQYNDLIQAIRSIFPEEVLKTECINNGFSVVFPTERLGFTLQMNNCRPVFFTAFSWADTDMNQRTSVLYEIHEEFHEFLWHFQAIYLSLVRELEYRVWRGNRYSL